MAEIKGLTIAIGADLKKFNKEMKSMDRSINNTNKQVNDLSKSLAIEFDADRFAEAQKLAQESISKTDIKVKALRDQLAYLEKTGGANTAGYEKLQTELVKTEAKAVLLKKKLEEIKDLKIEQLAGQFEKVGVGITKAGNAMKPLSIAAASLLGSFAAIGLSTVKYADDVATLSAQLNLSSESMQKWQYIAMQTDVSNNELQTAFTKTQAALADLSTGATGPGAEALQKLGLSMGQASLGMEANIDLIINKLAQIQDPVTQAALANELFGAKLGSKLIPLLQSGSRGLAELTKEFESLGYMSNEQVNSLAEFDNAMNKIKYSFQTIKNEIGAALLPVMQSLASFIETKIVPAVQKMADWFSQLSDKQKNTIMGTLAVIAALGPILLIIGKLTTGVGGLIKTVGGLSKALTVLMANPIVALIAVIVGLIILLYTKNEMFRESINNLFKTLASALMPILNILISTFKNMLVSLMPIINIFGNLLVPIINLASKSLGFMINLISRFLIPIIEILGKIFTTVWQGVADVIVQIVTFIESVINKVIDFINFLIRQVNKLGSLVGVTISEIDKLNIASTLNKPAVKEPNKTEIPDTPESILNSYDLEQYPQTVINNDYSAKDIKVEVIVQNYAEEVDVDNLVRQINMKLLEAL